MNSLIHIRNTKLFDRVFAKNKTKLNILIQNCKICGHDVEIKFGIDKYAMLVTHIGKHELAEGIQLLSNEIIRTKNRKEQYDNYGILGARFA